MYTQLAETIRQSLSPTQPWEHHIFENVLTYNQIDEVLNADISDDRIMDGTRAAGEKNTREYITKENCHKYPALLGLILDLQKKTVREEVENLLGIDTSNAYVRLEILRDTKSFWLQPHVDIPEKLMSGMIYVNTTNESESLGTDLYETDAEGIPQYVKTIPFKHNTGVIWRNDSHTYHGVEPGKKISVDRRGLQINYVTFETDWRCIP